MKRNRTSRREVSKYLSLSAKTLFFAFISIVLIEFLTCTVLVFFVDMSRLFNFPDKTGPLVNALGGTLSPFIGLIASMLIFPTSRLQNVRTSSNECLSLQSVFPNAKIQLAIFYPQGYINNLVGCL